MMIIMGVGLVVDAAGDTDGDDYICVCVACVLGDIAIVVNRVHRYLSMHAS